MISRWADLPWHVRFRARCRSWIIAATTRDPSKINQKGVAYGRKLADRYRT